MSLRRNLKRVQPGKPLVARTLNQLPEGAAWSSALSVAAPLGMTNTPAGPHIYWAGRNNIQVVLEGAGNPYSWSEQFPALSGGGPPIGRSGVNDAYEVNGLTGLNGQHVELVPSAVNDYRFQYVRFGGDCILCVSFDCTTNPDRLVIAFAPSKLPTGLQLVFTNVTTGDVTWQPAGDCASLPAGTYNIKADRGCFAPITNYAHACPRSDVVMHGTGKLRVQYLDCAGVCDEEVSIAIVGPDGVVIVGGILGGVAFFGNDGSIHDRPCFMDRCLWEPGTYTATLTNFIPFGAVHPIYGTDCFEDTTASVTVGAGCTGTITITPTPKKYNAGYCFVGCIGLPLEGIEVSLFGPSGGSTQVTDATGYVLFTGLSATCMYTLSAVDPNGKFTWLPCTFKMPCREISGYADPILLTPAANCLTVPLCQDPAIDSISRGTPGYTCQDGWFDGGSGG
jgi:hypothetical protein